jgi:hypothetical protein
MFLEDGNSEWEKERMGETVLFSYLHSSHSFIPDK